MVFFFLRFIPDLKNYYVILFRTLLVTIVHCQPNIYFIRWIIDDRTNPNSYHFKMIGLINFVIVEAYSIHCNVYQ